MKATWGLLVGLLLVAGPSISFFKYERGMPVVTTGQHYVIVDEGMWQHTRPGLSDLRLYSADREVPYVLAAERGSSEIEQKAIRVLQPATVGGKTQFLLDMSGLSEYDRVALELSTRNFVVHARVSGQDDPHGDRWASLGTTTLYDLSEEKLGRNATLQIPLTTYKFLQVTVDNAVKPSDVRGGTAGMTLAQKAVWRTLGTGLALAQQGKDTIVTFSVPENVPVERVVFEMSPAQPNFRRDVEIQGDKGNWFGSGEISRIHMQRSGQRIDVEQTSLDIRGGTGQGTLRAIIHNGDDAPLKITGERLQQYERRIYFDVASGAEYRLYYGDTGLEAPVYDYAKLFQRDAKASEAPSGAEVANSAYTGRPDERPWSERHPAVLWAAIIAVVLTLGGIALKSMRAATP
jgi:hypothetical protein